jgi:hypothetical protein
MVSDIELVDSEHYVYPIARKVAKNIIKESELQVETSRMIVLKAPMQAGKSVTPYLLPFKCQRHA